jgi:hypothetical protein
MSRDPLQTVTLPLLVDAETPENADGECTVFLGNHTVTQKVRIISPDALKKWLQRDTRTGLSRALRGLGKLKRAYAAEDPRATRAAIEEVRPLIPTFPGVTLVEDYSSEKICGGARWAFTETMGHAIKNARWTVWWPYSGNHEPAPGVYCPDMSTAVAMALFIEGVRVCPHCGAPFVPKQDNQDYCKAAHGVAYRTAKSRAKKRTESNDNLGSKNRRTSKSGAAKRRHK